MRFKKTGLSILLVVMLLCSNFSYVAASESVGEAGSVDTLLPGMPGIPLPIPTIPIVLPQPTPSPGQLGNEYWVPETYHQTSSSINHKKYKVGQVYAENRGSLPMTIQYSQDTTVSTTWQENYSVSVELEFKVSILASAKASAGFEVSTSRTVSRSSSTLASATIAPGKKGTITAYITGVYTYGYAQWNKIRETPEACTIVDTRKEWGGGWTVGQNRINYIFVESPL